MNDLELNPQELLNYVLEHARACGATAADTMMADGRSTEVKVRLGDVEVVKQSRSKGLGLRVFVGNRSAMTSTSDLNQQAVRALIARTCEAAKVLASDELAGLPDEARCQQDPVADLDLNDPTLDSFGTEQAIDMALETEAASRDADPRITNSEGAEVSWGTSTLHFASSQGLYRHATRGSISLWTMPIAEHAGTMERDYWYSSARHIADLAAPAEVAKEAARRTLRRLGAQKPGTAKLPVIFESPVASRLLGALGSAINGNAIYRNASYLVGKLDTIIASPLVNVHDDALLKRGPGSKTFDGEGLATGRNVLVEDGRLCSYLLDSYSARKLGMTPTHTASRGLGGAPHPGTTNFWMQPGSASLAELIADTKQGILVTELLGFGVNTVTGDYSQGAAGIWIEDGELTYPVHELTIASTLPKIWADIDAIASDRDPNRSVSAPSFRVREMTVAGN